MNYVRFFLFLTLLSSMPLVASENGDNEDFKSVKSDGDTSSTSSSYKTAAPGAGSNNFFVATDVGSNNSNRDNGFDNFSESIVIQEDEENNNNEGSDENNGGQLGNALTAEILAAAHVESEQETLRSRIAQWAISLPASIDARRTQVTRWAQHTWQVQQPRLQRLAENMFTLKWRMRIRSALKNRLLFRAHEDFASYFKEGVSDTDLKTILELLFEEVSRADQLLDNGLFPFEQYQTEAAPIALQIENLAEGVSTTFSHDETTLILANEKTLHLFSTQTGALTQKIMLPCEGAITALAFSPDDKVLCVAAGNRVYFYAVEKRTENNSQLIFVKTQEASSSDAEPVVQNPLQTKELSFVGKMLKKYENLSICRLNVQEKHSNEFNLFFIKVHLKGRTLSQQGSNKALTSSSDDPELIENDFENIDGVVHFECSCGGKNQDTLSAIEVFGFLDNGSLLLERDDVIKKIYPHMATGYSYEAGRNEATLQQYLYDFYTHNGTMGWTVDKGIPSCCFFLNQNNVVQAKNLELCQSEVGKTIVACSSKGGLVLVKEDSLWSVYAVKNRWAQAVRLFYAWGQDIKNGEASQRLDKVQIFFGALFILKKGIKNNPVSVQPYAADFRGEEASFLDDAPFYIKTTLQEAGLYSVERNRPKETIRELIMAGRWLDKRVIVTITTILMFLKRYHIWNKEGRAKLLNDVLRLIALGFYKPRRLAWNQ